MTFAGKSTSYSSFTELHQFSEKNLSLSEPVQEECDQTEKAYKKFHGRFYFEELGVCYQVEFGQSFLEVTLDIMIFWSDESDYLGKRSSLCEQLEKCAEGGHLYYLSHGIKRYGCMNQVTCSYRGMSSTQSANEAVQWNKDAVHTEIANRNVSVHTKKNSTENWQPKLPRAKIN